MKRAVCWYYFDIRFEEKKAEIAKFNASNRWKKRGISIVPVKFGIAFEEVFMNQVIGFIK